MVLLLKKDFEIIRAVGDGRELVDAAIALHPDVIVSDVSMPRLSGPQAQRELKAQGYQFPFVFISSIDELFGQIACSFVDKMDVCVDLVKAVQFAAAGETYISSRHRPHKTGKPTL